MRKLLTLAALLTSVIFCAQAQNTVRVGGGSGLAYEEGDKIIQIGLGLGRTVRSYNYVWAGGYYGLGASLNAAAELGIHEYFSVGLYAGVGRYGYRVIENYSITAIALGARGSFHYAALANEALDIGLNDEKLDLYISLLLGGEIISTNYDNEFNRFNDGFFVDFGTVLGGRYMLNESLAVFTELGYGSLSAWTIGVSFHL